MCGNSVPEHRPKPIPVAAAQWHGPAALQLNFITTGFGRLYLLDLVDIDEIAAMRANDLSGREHWRGAGYLDRTTLERLRSGEVRQVTEASTGEGQSSTAGFDARYRARK